MLPIELGKISNLKQTSQLKLDSSSEQKAIQAATSDVIINSLTQQQSQNQKLSGIKLVYIQYDTDKIKAQKLKEELATQNITIDNLIDLSTAGYKVPSGQFAIWLK